MPTNQKDSQIRESEDERDDVAAPQVDEIDVDDLQAMEGPDA